MCGMADRRLMMMQWDGLGADEEFFESHDRISSAVSINLAAHSLSDEDDEDDEDYDDNRISFATAISTPRGDELSNYAALAIATSTTSMSDDDYRIWMAEPGSIQERRKRLLQGMGLSSNKSLLKLANAEIKRANSNKMGKKCPLPPVVVVSASAPAENSKQEPSPPSLITRSRSFGSVEAAAHDAKQRKERLFGKSSSMRRLLRSSSSPSSLADQHLRLHTKLIKPSRRLTRTGSFSGIGNRFLSLTANKKGGSFFLIRNLDTGREFVVNETKEDGMWNRLRDLQTGKQITMEEFEKYVGYSPIVSELMRRENVASVPDDRIQRLQSIRSMQRKVNSNISLGKSFRSLSKRVSLLKNIKGVASSINGFIGDREREQPSMVEQRSAKPGSSSPGWTKVRNHGKSCKELTALYMCQEIPAHEGAIWAIRFSYDARYMASAGEDRVIHIWEVVDCDPTTLRPIEEANFTPLHPMMGSSPDRPLLAEAHLVPSGRRKGRISSFSRKQSSISDYVVMPETVFSLSEKPICTLQGHLDDVLDLSWSKSQLLLSSSMDKTVRLWDIETRSCLKLFAHNDYVTCIQFNPNDDRYFISGSLDAKVRIWSIPDRQVVDWADLHEMVTAACYTPDGQGALVGTHKGSCRLYNISGYKLHLKSHIDVKGKKKSHGKKITGFQFAPGNPSEVLITSADSRIRIFQDSDVVHKFTGFRNTSSQIAASFTPDGKHVVCASEDSQVYVWKHDENRHTGGGKTKGQMTTSSYEHFQCRDVSVAIPWPGSTKYQPPLVVQSKRHSKRLHTQPLAYLGLVPGLEEAFSRSGSVSRRHFPPLHRKINSSERASTCPEEELTRASRSHSLFGGSTSFTSDSNSFSYGDSPYISASGSSSSSWRWFDNASNSSRHSVHSTSVHATAWGMVIVTASLGGEIRTYQNLGLPIRLSRQTNLYVGNPGSV